MEIEENIPKVDLQEKHIRNLKTLANREDLIKKMPKNQGMAEIGVDQVISQN